MMTGVLIGLAVLVVIILLFYFFPYRFLEIVGLVPYIIYKQIYISRLLRKSRFFVTSRGNIEFIFKGNNGPVLLYIHGSPGGCDQNIEPTQKYRVLTPSRPGYRRTDISVGKTPEQQADSFKALLDTLEIDKVFIMGVSGGGPSSMHFAAKYPEKTLGLILFEAVSFSQDFIKKDEALINSWDFRLFIQLLFMSSFGNDRLAKMMLPNEKNRLRLLEKKENIVLLKKIIWSIWPMSIRRLGIENDYKQFTNLNIPYDKISSPVLILHGDDDINVDIEHARHANKAINHSSLYILKEADHMMHATHSEEIEKQIESFISNYS
jgi:pimeloyl-ACP methyl ester carboxylesterase